MNSTPEILWTSRKLRVTLNTLVASKNTSKAFQDKAEASKILQELN